MDGEITSIIHGVVQRAPQWLRQDLTSKDDAARSRAEETLTAMIADALAKEVDA